MGIHVDRLPTGTRARIEGDLTIGHAAALKGELVAALLDAPALALDLSAVTEMDGAGLQLLLLLQREAAHRPLRLEGCSPAVAQVLALAAWAPRQQAEGMQP